MHAPGSARQSEYRHSLLLAVLAVGYFAAGKLGLVFATVNSSASALWPPTGIALAAVLVFGYRVWPSILLGAFFVNATTSGTALTSLGIACGNTLEAVAAAYFVNRLARGRQAFARPYTTYTFAAVGLMAATLSATIGVTSLALGGYVEWATAGPVWMTWWLGDAAGAIVVTPLILLWYANPVPTYAAGRRAEALLLLVSVIATGLIVFVGPVLSHYPLAFLCIPVLGWAAFRFGQREVMTAIALLTVMAAWATVHSIGPFVMNSANESLIVLQLFMGTMTLVKLPLAALVRERERMHGADRSAREDAEATNRAKDEFLAMLGHELRNPLAAISAAIGVLREASSNTDLQGHALSVANRQTLHLAHLVDDMLDVSRVSSGKLALKSELVELSVVIARAIESARPQVESRGHRLQLDLADDPVWVQGDLTRLAQVVLNLLSNAAKYTPDHGRIRVTLTKGPATATIRVRDDGVGMSPALIPHVFDLFAQDGRTLERSQGGLGIGLSLARRLVDLHGGTIQAMSDGPGRGSEFIVELPLSSAQPFPARVGGHATEQLAPASPARRILVVDDNVDAADSLAALLRLRGNDVRVANDGASAIRVADEYRPDVALLDIGLPGMSGYDLARRLRENAANRRMLLVAVTGYGRDEDQRDARLAGFDEHLLKPVPFDAVERLLSTIPPPSISS